MPKQSRLIRVSILALSSAIWLQADPLSDSLRPLKDFLQGPHSRGVPIERAIELGKLPGAVEYLISIIEGPDAFGAEAATIVLGLTGDPRAVTPLINFIEGPDPTGFPISESSYYARSSAILALGCFAHRTNNDAGRQRVLKYLKQGQQIFCWDGLARWESPVHRERLDRNVHLAQLAIQSLGLTGLESALDEKSYGLLWLTKHLEAPQLAAQEDERIEGLCPHKWEKGQPSRLLVTSLKRLAESAVQANKEIQRLGSIGAYYDARTF